MKLDIKNKHQIQQLLRLTTRDAAPERYQLRPVSLQTLQPSYALSKMKTKTMQSENRIFDFDSTKNPINKLAMNNRRLLIAAEFHYVHPVEKES